MQRTLMTRDVALTLGSHTRTVRSFDAEAMRLPEGENLTSVTPSVCPANLKARRCALKLHSMRVESSEPEISCVMFGAKASDVMVFLCPRNVRSSDGIASSATKLSAMSVSVSGAHETPCPL